MDQITEIEPHLYLGNAQNVVGISKQFDDLNIDVVVNCCDEIFHNPTKRFVVYNYPIADDGNDDSFEKYVEEIVGTINMYVAGGKNVYVHCLQGISRSAAIVIYYLMRYHKISFNLAYSKILFVRTCIQPHLNFVRVLKRKDTYKSEDDDFLQNQFSDIE